jgi:hypothetical protein
VVNASRAETHRADSAKNSRGAESS